MEQKLTIKDVAQILCVSPTTITRLLNKEQKEGVAYTYDPDLPVPEIIGRSKFFNSDEIYEWLSKKANKKVTAKDKLLMGKDVQDFYQRSSTWVWQQVKAGSIRKPFKITTINYWLSREIVGEVKDVQ